MIKLNTKVHTYHSQFIVVWINKGCKKMKRFFRTINAPSV